MNCPNCGTNTEGNHQYCRSCGAELTGAKQPAFNIQAWGLFTLMLIFGGLLIAMGGKMWAVKWVTFLGLVITFGGMFGIAAYGLMRQTRPRKRAAASVPLKQPEILKAETTRKLPALDDSDFVPSVIDDTTELLKTPVSRGSTPND